MIQPRIYRTPAILETLFPGILWGGETTPDSPVYFTFDDGPRSLPDTAPLLSILKSYGIQAAFFSTGRRLSSCRESIESISFEGHLLGYHGFSHRPWWFKPAFVRQLEMAPCHTPKWYQDLLKNQPFPLLLRPPFGRFDPFVLHDRHGLSAHLVMWRLVLYDWKKGLDGGALINDLTNRIKPGDIVVLHEKDGNSSLLPDVLEKSLPEMQRNGIKFGQFSDLLAGKTT